MENEIRYVYITSFGEAYAKKKKKTIIENWNKYKLLIIYYYLQLMFIGRETRKYYKNAYRIKTLNKIMLISHNKKFKTKLN